MKMSNIASRTVKQIFDSFTSDDDYEFSKTIVPVRLAQLNEEFLL